MQQMMIDTASDIRRFIQNEIQTTAATVQGMHDIRIGSGEQAYGYAAIRLAEIISGIKAVKKGMEALLTSLDGKVRTPGALADLAKFAEKIAEASIQMSAECMTACEQLNQETPGKE